MVRTAVTAQLFIEVCAGTCRLSRAVAEAGVPTWSFEISRGGRNEDVLQPECLELLLSLIRAGRVACLWLGLTCSSWSRARRGKRQAGTIGRRGGFPAPLRSNERPWGLPRSDLTASELKKLDHGNDLVKWAMKILRQARLSGTCVVLENPRTSRMWDLPELKELMTRSDGSEFAFGTFHACQYGKPWKKATSLAMWGRGRLSSTLAKGLRKCKGRRCQATGKKHERLQGFGKGPTGPNGKGTHGNFKTVEASSYPPEFCKDFAKLLVESLT